MEEAPLYLALEYGVLRTLWGVCKHNWACALSGCSVNSFSAGKFGLGLTPHPWVCRADCRSHLASADRRQTELCSPAQGMHGLCLPQQPMVAEANWIIFNFLKRKKKQTNAKRKTSNRTVLYFFVVVVFALDHVMTMDDLSKKTCWFMLVKPNTKTYYWSCFLWRVRKSILSILRWIYIQTILLGKGNIFPIFF